MSVSNITATNAQTILDTTNGSTIRDKAAATNGSGISAGSTHLLCGYFYLTSFGGVYANYRSYMSFDLSGESGTVTAVTITLKRANSANFPDLYFLASEAGDTLATTDYQDGLVGATGYPYTSDVTLFKDDACAMDDGGSAGDTVTFTLNAAAVTHANNVIGTSNRFKTVIVNTYDYNDTYDSADDGFSNAFAHQGIEFESTNTGTQGAPILNLTIAAATEPPTTISLSGGSFTINGGSLTIK
tara:strand:+ start:9 stop:737 length:729 start_codon:yes stop_codon:yes gene_type:complete